LYPSQIVFTFRYHFRIALLFWIKQLGPHVTDWHLTWQYAALLRGLPVCLGIQAVQTLRSSGGVRRALHAETLLYHLVATAERMKESCCDGMRVDGNVDGVVWLRVAKKLFKV
jgi:hypothetical protein